MRDFATIDIRENLDGDLMIVDGDFRITNIEHIENGSQYVNTILNTPLDMEILPYLGIILDDFIGEQNTEENAEIIRTSVQEALILDGYIPRGSIAVDVYPTSATEVAIYIILTSLNSDSRSTITTAISFDYLTGRIYSLRG